MNPLVDQHLLRLRILCGAFIVSTAMYGAIVFLIPPPQSAVLAQGEHLLWIFGLVAAVNIVTLMPVYRAMMARPRRVFAVGRELAPLLSAHFACHAIAHARLEAVAVLGLVLFFITGRGDWFWIFNGTAIVGMLLLWPLREKVEALQNPAV